MRQITPVDYKVCTDILNTVGGAAETAFASMWSSCSQFRVHLDSPGTISSDDEGRC